MPETSEFTRLSVNVSQHTEELLAGYQACGLSATELIRRAVPLYDLLARHLREGGVVELQRPDGGVLEVVLVPDGLDTAITEWPTGEADRG